MLPLRRSFDPADIPKLLPHLVLLDVFDQPRDFRYRVIGSEVRRYLHADYTGKRLTEIPHQKPPSIIFSNLEWVADHGRPLYGNTPYIGPQKGFRFSEEMILPLGSADGRVTHLLVGLRFLPVALGAERQTGENSA